MTNYNKLETKKKFLCNLELCENEQKNIFFCNLVNYYFVIKNQLFYTFKPVSNA